MSSCHLTVSCKTASSATLHVMHPLLVDGVVSWQLSLR